MSTSPLRQVRIAGTYDPVVPEIQEIAEQFIDHVRGRKKLKAAEDELRDQLITAMRENDICECSVEEFEIRLEQLDRIKVKEDKSLAPAVDDEIDPFA